MHACRRVNVNENLQLAQKASAFGPFGPTNAQKPEERPVQKRPVRSAGAASVAPTTNPGSALELVCMRSQVVIPCVCNRCEIVCAMSGCMCVSLRLHVHVHVYVHVCTVYVGTRYREARHGRAAVRAQSNNP